jgi:hypothetical protein
MKYGACPLPKKTSFRFWQSGPSMLKTTFSIGSVFALLACVGMANSQGNTLSKSSLKIAERDRQIEEQRQKNKTLSLMCEKTISDSIAADAKADQRIDSLARVMVDLSGQISKEKNSLSALQKQLSSLEALKAAQETEHSAASVRSHSAISLFEPVIASCKNSLEAAKSGLDLARTDSIDLNKKIVKEAARSADSLKVMEQSLAAFKRAIDGLSLAKKNLTQDSLFKRKTNDDSLKAVRMRIQEMRRTMASRDSAVKSATEELNKCKKDILDGQSENQKGIQKREMDMKTLDSIVSASQDQKTKLFRVREKFQLDSAIQALSEQLKVSPGKTNQASDTAPAPEDEKAQMINNYKGKIDILMRDEAFAVMIAGLGQAGWQERIVQINSRLGTEQKTLDSASEAREKIVRDGVMTGKQFQQIQKKMAAESVRLNDCISKTWRELINAKPLLAKMEQDSAVAVKRCESTSESYQKKLAAVTAEAAAAAAGADSMTRRCDALKTYIAEKEIGHQKQLAISSTAIIRAAEAVRSRQTAFDSVNIRQRASRDDSIQVDKEKSVPVAQARQAAGTKKEEIKLKNDAINAIAAMFSKVKNDSTMVLREKGMQRSEFCRLIEQQQRMIRLGEKAISDLEAAAPAMQSPAKATPAAPPEVQPGPKQSPSNEYTQQLTHIYELIEQGKTSAAKAAFNSNRKMLKKNLDPEAFSTIKMTVESLGKGPSNAQVTAKAAAPTPPPVVTAPPPVQEPQEPGKPATAFISSLPPVASVFMDGQPVGKTNVGYVKVMSGKHTMQFIKGDKTCTMEMTFSEGQNPAVVVKLPCGQ